MKINRITITGVLATLALIMAPGFMAQAASASPSIPVTANDIATPDAKVEAPEVKSPEVETPDAKVEAPEVKSPEVETPEVGE